MKRHHHSVFPRAPRTAPCRACASAVAIASLLGVPRVALADDALPSKSTTDAAPAGAAGSAKPAGSGGAAQALPAISVGAARAAADAGNLSKPAGTGSRLGLSSLDTPASVETLDGERIRERGDTSVLDAVTRAAGFAANAAPGNGGTSVSVRGFSGPESITTLYDGTRMLVGAGTVTFPVDTWSVERIEVLRGPASVLYGEGGLGGVINVVPKAPQRERETSLLVGAGSYGQKRFALDTTGALGPMLSYRFHVNDDRQNGWVPRGESHLTSVGGALKLDVNPSLSFTLDYDFARQKPMTYFGVPVIDGVLDPAMARQNYNVGDASIAYYDRWARLNTTWRAAPGITVRNQFYGMLTDRHWRDSESYALQGDGSVLRSDYIEIRHHERQVGDRLDTTFDGHLLGRQNRLVVGAEFNDVSFVDTSNTPFDGQSVVPAFGFDPGSFSSPDATVPVFRTHTRQAGVFAEDRIELSDRLSWISGLRYDYIDYQRDTFATPSSPASSFSKTFAHTSWRTGLVFSLTPDISLYGQYTTGTDGVGSLITLSKSSSAFNLSTGDQWEAGFKQAFAGGRGAWTLAFYQIVKRNLLSVDPQNPGQTIQVGKQSSRGVEWTGAFKLGHGISIDANAAFLRARYDDFNESVDGVSVSRAGKVPINIPQQTANLWLDWAFAPGWRAGAGLRYVGRSYGDTANTVPLASYTLLDASASWRATKDLTLSLYLHNLTNRVYVETSQNSGSEWLLGAPRSGGVTATLKF
ncbi:TonB-dependent receptor [Burkholderia gladioli]|uniref:TonB-dependent receptor n=1 Tax=Burkholderia gladioli TaxID=28095 RepID=UPI000CFF3818|nr:TonB-dependent receptor [Burkholderia gladioli]PRG44740.1 TonB-dependent siderophore receptor [Burkholderia gladioli]